LRNGPPWRAQASRVFADRGIKRGDKVLLILPRVPEWWIAMLGLIRLGAVPAPGTPLADGEGCGVSAGKSRKCRR